MSLIGSLIGAGTSLLGGLFGKNSAEDAADKNAKLQKEFAQSGIQWKVEDAKKAGVHPLAALGAQTASFSPSYVGDTSMGQGLANAGQSVARSLEATSSAPDKLGRMAQSLALERGQLENDLLRSQIAVTNSQLTPPMPTATEPYLIPGQPGSGVTTKAMERIASAHNHPYMEAGAINELGFAQTRGGGLAPVMSKDVKDRLEEDTIGTLGWNLRNRLFPMSTPYSKKGYVYMPWGEYVPLPWKSHHGN